MEANQEKDRGEVQRERDRRHKIEVGERSPRDRGERNCEFKIQKKKESLI